MFFGEYLIYKGKVTVEDLNFALKLQKNENIISAISAITNDYLTYEDVSNIMDYMRSTGLKFYEAAVNLRMLDEGQAKKVLIDRKRIRHPIGEMLVMCGAISRTEMEKELKNFLDD